MPSFMRIATAGTGQKIIGVLGAYYLRLVWKTSRVIVEPAGFYEHIDRELPIIVAMWHGQHFMAPFLKRKQHRVKVLISRHRDGEINAIAAEHLGIETIRGSGSQGTPARRSRPTRASGSTCRC